MKRTALLAQSKMENTTHEACYWHVTSPLRAVRNLLDFQKISNRTLREVGLRRPVHRVFVQGQMGQTCQQVVPSSWTDTQQTNREPKQGLELRSGGFAGGAVLLHWVPAALLVAEEDFRDIVTTGILGC